MKTLKVLTKVIAFTSFMLINSCKSKEEIVPLPTFPQQQTTDKVTVRGTPEINKNVYVMDDRALDYLIEIKGNVMYFKELPKLRNARIAATTGAVEVTGIKKGDIIVAPSNAKAENGLMVEVENVSNNEVTVKEATISDAFQSLDISWEASFGEGVEINVGKDIKATGSASLTFNQNFDLVVEDSKLKYLNSQVTTQKKLGLSVTANGSVSDNGEVNVFEKRYRITRWIPLGGFPFPLVLTPVVRIFCTYSASGEAQISAKLIDYNDVSTLGGTYTPEKGWQKKEDKPTGSFSPPNITAEVKGRISVGIKGAVEAYFYDFKSFTVGGSLEVYGGIGGECKTDGNGLEVYTFIGLNDNLSYKLDAFGESYTGTASLNLPEVKSEPFIIDTKYCKKDETDSTKTGESLGDPHIFTIDRGSIHFQAVGEFIVAKSTADKFEIQVRQEEIKSRNDKETVSFNTGLAINTGSDLISVFPKTLYINNKPTSINKGETLQLTQGGSISEKDNTLLIRTAANDRIKIFLRNDAVDFAYSPAPIRRGKLIGLMGNFNGNAEDDYKTRNGEAIKAIFSELYPKYADSWRINKSESLFYYELGKDTDSYTNKNYPKNPIQITQDKRKWAEGVCKNAGVKNGFYLESCIVDVSLTNDESYAKNIYQIQNESFATSTSTTGTLLFGNTAFDAQTGKMKWVSYDIDTDFRGSIYKSTFFIPYAKSRSFGINAINMSDGSIKWKYTAASPVYGIPAFTGDLIYVTTQNSVLALNSNTGALKWEYKAGSVTDWLLRGCTVQNNFVYVPYTAGQNTKDSAPKTDILDANTGKKIRTFDGKVEINPSVLDDIVFLSRSNSNKCQGVSAYTTSTGNKVWENCALQVNIEKPIKIIGKTLYHYAQSYSTGLNHSIIAADSKTGQLKWKIEFNNSSSSTPSLVSFDEKYFAYTIRTFTSGNVSSGRTILRIHNLSDGSLMWEKEIKKGQFADTPIPLVAGETIYVDSETSTGHNLTAYDAKTGNTIWVANESAGGGSYLYPILISNNGIIYQGAASPF